MDPIWYILRYSIFLKITLDLFNYIIFIALGHQQSLFIGFKTNSHSEYQLNRPVGPGVIEIIVLYHNNLCIFIVEISGIIIHMYNNDLAKSKYIIICIYYWIHYTFFFCFIQRYNFY